MSSGGLEIVSSGGVASGTTVSSGGALTTLLAGSALATTILSGGLEIVSSGGVASGTTISSGGTLELFGGAAMSGTTTIIAGGMLQAISGYNVLVGSGQTSVGVILLNAGSETVLSSGLGIGTIVSGWRCVDGVIGRRCEFGDSIERWHAYGLGKRQRAGGNGVVGRPRDRILGGRCKWDDRQQRWRARTVRRSGAERDHVVCQRGDAARGARATRRPARCRLA